MAEDKLTLPSGPITVEQGVDAQGRRVTRVGEPEPASTVKGKVQPNQQQKPGPIGNTLMLVVPKTSPNLSGSGKMPADTPETTKEQQAKDQAARLKALAKRANVANASKEEVDAILEELAQEHEAVAALDAANDPFKPGYDVGLGSQTASNEATLGGIGAQAQRLSMPHLPFGERALATLEGAAGMMGGGRAGAAGRAAAGSNRAAKLRALKQKVNPKPKTAEPTPPQPPGGHVKGPKKKGPCDHLRRGDGKGPYRGGAHSETSKPRNDGKDSHHAPADDSSPLPRKDGPTVQMDPTDHKNTTSNGSGRDAVLYREKIEGLIAQGKWRDAMAEEVKDIRRVAREAGNPKKYNEAIKEMLAYYKCLASHGLPAK